MYVLFIEDDSLGSYCNIKFLSAVAVAVAAPVSPCPLPTVQYIVILSPTWIIIRSNVVNFKFSFYVKH